ncbi:hypothetical protein ABZZ20_05905 [Streptomyces sp. NPDC006430]|uniref:hypothetical protein n=1 Tax=Streptomyces sp. NPDC006430 TaxID=3154299 RepID=UPI0033BC5125
MTAIPGLGDVPSGWLTERAKWLLSRQRRSVRPEDKIVTAFRDGQVTLRDNRRTDGFTNAIQEIGYQGIREGDLVVHGMDGFAGAIGVSDSDGKASPVVHAYQPAENMDVRFAAYALRTMALNGYVATLAKGIRERSTAFDGAALANVVLPVPSLDEQRRIADFLDVEATRIDSLNKSYRRLKGLAIEQSQAAIDAEIEKCRDLIPFRYVVRFREGPGIMAADFRDEGVPLVRIAGLQGGQVTLNGCNFLDSEKVSRQWSQFCLKLGDRLISGSATMGAVSVVADLQVVGAIPYTGLIILRPAQSQTNMEYVEAFLCSSFFSRQIDVLKTGAAMQHFGPTHLAQVRSPLPSPADQRRIAKNAKVALSHARRAGSLADRQIRLLAERRQALITAAVTGQFDVSTASGRNVTEGITA